MNEHLPFLVGGHSGSFKSDYSVPADMCIIQVLVFV